MKLQSNLLKYISRVFCWNNNIHHSCTFSVWTKSSQLETAKMSKLKVIPLKDISESTFNLFQKIRQQNEIDFLTSLFQSNGFEIRMAGGAVRDLLCHIVPNDIDFASNAKPDEMIKMMEDKPEIRLITTPSGIKHGTVTARINDKSQYEITTLRIDVNTDGRFAQVQFTDDWKLDSSRRDLTINSMFIDSNGLLYDYFDGESDLRNKRIRFVGDTEKRIQEDYLRIFRYFRFHTRFGIPGSHDQETIAKIKQNVCGLASISGERIWMEMKKILSNLNCTDVIELMLTHLNIGNYMGFNSSRNINLQEFYKVRDNLRKFDDIQLWKPCTLFASLIDTLEELSPTVIRLKLSNLERDTIIYIISNRDQEEESTLLNKETLQYQLAMEHEPNQKQLKETIVQFLMYKGETKLMKEILEWDIPKFPFNGNMIFANIGARQIKNKRQIGVILNKLKQQWIKQKFSMSQQQFVNEVNKLLSEFK